MKFVEYTKEYIQKINNAIKSIYERKISNVSNPFLKNYYLELKDYFLSGGKRIRPILSIATCNAFSENQNDKIILPSVGVEFLHNASLIHDDIIDKDDFRRGAPAFHFRFRNYHQQYNIKKMNDVDFGNSIGIIGGDTAFFLGLEAFLFNEFESELNFRAIDYYEQAFIEIANGVLIETDMVNQRDLTIQDYIKMISLKTGALIEKSILIGANYAKVEKKYFADLSIYGTNLGIIFQIIDDILGTFGDEKITGKPKNDIREGKKTCLLITALNVLDKTDKVRLEEFIEKPNMNEKEVQKVKDLFIKADVVNSCKQLAEAYFQEAKLALDRLKSEINQNEYEFFEDLLNFVLVRKF